MDIASRGFNFNLTRTYRSKIKFNGILGHNWDFSFNEQLVIPDPASEDQSIVRSSGSGRLDMYTKNEDGTYSSPSGYFDVLKKLADGTYQITGQDGHKTLFNSDGKLAAHIDPFGNTQSYAYDSENRISVVTDTLGREIKFAYRAGSGRLETVTDFTGRTVRYYYDNNGDLIQVRTPTVTDTPNGNDFPAGKFTFYTYSSGFDEEADPRLAALNHNLLTVTDAQGQTYLVNTYNNDPDSYSFDRIVKQQFGEPGQEFIYTYQALNEGKPYDPNQATNLTVEIDRAGNKVDSFHNDGGQLLREVVYSNRNVNPDAAAEYVTTHTYNTALRRISTTLPSGDRIERTYDSENTNRRQQGNMLSQTHIAVSRDAKQSTLTTSFTYEPIYNQLSSETDANGHTTRYVYDYQHANNAVALASQLGVSTSILNAWLAEADVELKGGVEGQLGGNLVSKTSPLIALADGTEQQQIESHAYNVYGQKVKAVDAEGIVTLYNYYPANDPDGDGDLTQSTRTLDGETGGYLKSVVLDAESHARRTRTAGLLKIEQTTTYDERGNVLSKTDGEGHTTRYVVNSLDQIVRKIDPAPLNYVTDYFYDANNNLQRVRTYNNGVTGPNQGEYVDTVYTYDVLNNRTSETKTPEKDQSLTTLYIYDANDNLVSIKQPQGNVVQRVYDERDLVHTITQGFGSADASTRTMSYDANGNLIKTVDAVDNDGDGKPDVTTLGYDAFDRLVEQTDAEGNRLAYQYDANGNRVRESRYGNSGIDGQAQEIWLSDISMTFDSVNRPYKRTDLILENGVPKGGLDNTVDREVITQMMYDRNNQVLSTVDDNNNTATSVYDGLNRLVTKQDANGNTQQFAYDNNGNVLTITNTEISVEGLVADKVTTTTMTYDAINRLSTEQNSLGNTTSYRYDNRGNKTSETDALGNVTLYIHDGMNRLLEERRLLSPEGIGSGGLDVFNPVNSDGGISTFYEYDKNNRLSRLTDDNGNDTVYGYDDLNRETSISYADGSQVIKTYDADGNMVSKTDQNGTVNTYSYDALNRLTAIEATLAEGVVGSNAWRYTYDGLGRRTQLTDNNDPAVVGDDSTVQLRYNSLNQLISETSHGRTIQVEYDGLGNRQSLRYPNGRQINYSYDNVYNLKAISEQSNQSIVASFNYAGIGRVLNRTYGNGTVLNMVTGLPDSTDSGYDAINRIVEIQHNDSQGTRISGFNYVYDKANNSRYEIDQFTQMADVYEYDSAYRLIRAAYQVPASEPEIQDLENNNNVNADVATVQAANDVTWLLDGVGNWVSEQTLSPASSDAVGYITTNMNEYSRIGPQEQQHDNNGNLIADGERFYHYDGRNRLVRVTTLAGNTVAYYQYDALNRRSKKAAANEVVQYHYFGKQVLEERNALGQMQRQFVYGTRLDQVLQMKTAANDYYYHANRIGSISAVSDNNGQVVERYDYTAYGETSITDALGAELERSAINNPYRFTARRYDAETGFYYYRARFYAPERGRFIQRDPIGYADGMGVYAYVGNNPINWIDPLGTERSGLDEFVDAITDPDFYTDHLGPALYDEFIGDPLQDIADGKLLDAACKLAKPCRALDKLGDAIPDKVKDKIGDTCCFVAGTPVLTEEGYKDIEDVRLNDLVLSKDVETGEQQLKPVTRLYQKYRLIYALTVMDASGELETIRTTDDHPFYVIGEKFVNVIDLIPGQYIETKNGEFVAVVKVTNTGEYEKTYNLEVADFHTYYATELNLLVHNCDYPKSNRGPGSVPPSERDPRRTLPQSERPDVYERQDGKCVGCNEPKDMNDMHAHHRERHADGGPTTKENTDLLCPTCHKHTHSKDP